MPSSPILQYGRIRELATEGNCHTSIVTDFDAEQDTVIVRNKLHILTCLLICQGVNNSLLQHANMQCCVRNALNGCRRVVNGVQ